MEKRLWKFCASLTFLNFDITPCNAYNALLYINIIMRRLVWTTDYTVINYLYYTISHFFSNNIYVYNYYYYYFFFLPKMIYLPYYRWSVYKYTYI